MNLLLIHLQISPKMLGIKSYQDALVHAMQLLNSTEWYGSINGHGHVLHFTMWCLHINAVKVFHVHMDKLPWKDFTDVCMQFVARNALNLKLLLQDNEQPLLTGISCLPLSHLAAEVHKFMKTARIFNDHGRVYHGNIFEAQIESVPCYNRLANLLSNNIGSTAQRRDLTSNIDVHEIFSADVEQGFQSSLAGLIAEGLIAHPMQGEVTAIFFKAMRDICSSDADAAVISINECTALLDSPDNIIVRQYRTHYHCDNILQSLQRIGTAISNAFHADMLLLSYDYHVALRCAKSRSRSNISAMTIQHIIKGETFPAGTFKSLLGNASLEVEFVKLQLDARTVAQLLLFDANLYR